jgi:hypothetical protein
MLSPQCEDLQLAMFRFSKLTVIIVAVIIPIPEEELE